MNHDPAAVSILSDDDLDELRRYLEAIKRTATGDLLLAAIEAELTGRYVSRTAQRRAV